MKEIQELGIVDRLKTQGNPSDRRAMVKEWIESSGDFSATSTLVTDDAVRQLVLLISEGKMIEDGREIPDQEPLGAHVEFELATISGEPLGPVKVGLRSMDARKARALESRGGSTILKRDYPARFHCSLKEAVRLLDIYGYRVGRRKHVLYEVGGPLEEEALASVQPKAEKKGAK